jgi:hypothetical protein
MCVGSLDHLDDCKKKKKKKMFGILTPLSAIFQLYHGDQF